MIMGSMPATSSADCRLLPVSCRFASAKRAASWPCRTNARMTLAPMICSRRIRVTPSISACPCRYSGIRRRTMTVMIRTSRGTMAITTTDRAASCWTARTMPPMPMTGAAASIVKTRTAKVWICCTSLVARVTRLGAPKALTSWEDISWTLANRLAPEPVADLHGHSCPEVSGPQRGSDLDNGDRCHPAAEPQDHVVTAEQDAVVDDAGVQCGQQQVAGRLDHLQHNDGPAPRHGVPTEGGA